MMAWSSSLLNPVTSSISLGKDSRILARAWSSHSASSLDLLSAMAKAHGFHIALVHDQSRDVRPAHGLGGDQASVAGADHHALALDHDGEPLAEALEAARDGGEVALVMLAGVGGVEG